MNSAPKKKLTTLTDIIMLDGEAGAALDTTALENLLTGLGVIALHEAVLDFALDRKSVV